MATIHTFELKEATRSVAGGAAFADLRPAPAYLDVHIPGSLCLHYESGPGMASRARDCVPLEVPLILMDEGQAHVHNAAAALRGKGFTVLGTIKGALAGWGSEHGHPASTESVDAPVDGDFVLDVRDPGARRLEGATVMPVERLWRAVATIPAERRVLICAGAGVRAALAAGILERHGREVALYRV